MHTRWSIIITLCTIVWFPKTRTLSLSIFTLNSSTHFLSFSCILVTRSSVCLLLPASYCLTDSICRASWWMQMTWLIDATTGLPLHTGTSVQILLENFFCKFYFIKLFPYFRYTSESYIFRQYMHDFQGFDSKVLKQKIY